MEQTRLPKVYQRSEVESDADGDTTMVEQTTWQRTALVWQQWTIATALGEVLGFVVPTVAALTAATLGLSDLARFPFLIIAGAAEGAILGLGQAIVLHRYLPHLARRDWVAATAGAAALAWLIGLLPSTLGPLPAIPTLVAAVGAILLGVSFLLLMGVAQWLVLRHHVPRASWWIAANAVAWPLGVAVSIAGIGMIPDGASPWVMGLFGIASGLAMGLIVGAITGTVLLWLLRERDISIARSLSGATT